MAKTDTFTDVPNKRARRSRYGQGDSDEQFVTRQEIVDLLRNISKFNIDMDTTDTLRPGEPIRTVLQYVGPTGTATDTRLLPISKTGNLGSAISPSPLTATDAGADATITVASFTPQFDFGTLSVTGASITGQAYSTKYYVYLTAFSYTNGSYTSALATTSLLTLASNPGYFYIGTITTPAASDPPTGGTGGGGEITP